MNYVVGINIFLSHHQKICFIKYVVNIHNSIKPKIFSLYFHNYVFFSAKVKFGNYILLTQKISRVGIGCQDFAGGSVLQEDTGLRE